jgi:uncharacterized protein YciI
MKHFLVMAHDAHEPNTQAKRAAAREAHLAGIQELLGAGSFLFGGALLNDDDEIAGSVLVMRFPDRGTFDEWLANDPYMTTGVWGEVDVRPCRPAAIPNAPWDKSVVD